MLFASQESDVALQSLQELHIPYYLQSFVEPVRRLLHVTGIDAERDYLYERLPLVDRQETFFFVLMHTVRAFCLGAIEIRGPGHSGQLYCWLHPDFWGKGYFGQALQVAAAHYFETTHALYFTAHVDISNGRSYAALKKCGFADYRLLDGPYGKQYELMFVNKGKS